MHQTLPSPHLPIGLPSPTLTNPDMILPDSSPSADFSLTPRQDKRLPALPTGDIDYDENMIHSNEKLRSHAMIYKLQGSAQARHDGRTRFRSSSERGDNRKSLEQNRLSFQRGEETAVATSPTLPDDPNDLRERIYTESTQGDYENGEGTYSTPAILEEDENDPYSHAAMTRRAEEILANAKKRLTNMEGNLNRARSTLNGRPSSSMSSYGNRNPEPISLYTLPGKGRGPAGFSPTKHREATHNNIDEAKQGHLRVFSETSVPSSLQTEQAHGRQTGGSEHPNGLGIKGVDGAIPDRHSEPSRNWFWNGLTRNTSLNHTNRHPNGLQALNEDGPALESFEQRATREDIIEEEQSIDLQSPTVTEFNAKHPPTNGLTRARSTTQMRDLREQMQDLKGKISTLKQRAREDNLRRRSLQSLRTPSPFTVAEQWYAGDSHSDDPGVASVSDRAKDIIASRKSDEHSRSPPQDSGHASPIMQINDKKEIHNAALDDYPSNEVINEAEDDTDDVLDVKSANGFPSPKKRLVLIDEPSQLPNVTNSDISDLENVTTPTDNEAKEDSLFGDQDYHEASTSPPAVERHEDRPDAFDYEHFILHSAMGSYSGVGVRRSSSRRKRADSQSSESSVETTKPRNSTGDAPQGEERLSVSIHGRQGSVDTVSSVNTFATADEVQDTDSDNQGRTLRDPMAEPDNPENARTHKTNGSGGSSWDQFQSNGYRPGSRSAQHIATAQKGYTNGVTSRSPPITKGPPPPPPDLLTVLSATSSWQEGAPPRKISLGERDKELVERLVKSLAKVCSQVQSLDTGESKYEARVVRRKLDAARRVLDGEMNGEAF